MAVGAFQVFFSAIACPTGKQAGEHILIEIKVVRDSDEIATVARLAREIWHEYYAPIIGQAQVDYMVPKFQSESAIAEQIGDGSL